MRRYASLTMLLALSLITSALMAEEKKAKEAVSPMFRQGIVQNSRLVGVDSRGHLTSNDLNWGTKRDYGALDRKLGPYIDVLGDRACVATKSEVCEVDLASGKVVRSANHKVGIGGVGFIGANRVFIHNGRSLEIIDLSSGETTHQLDLQNKPPKKRWYQGKSLIAHSRHNELLYVASAFEGRVAVVDLNLGKRIKEIETGYGWTTGLHVAGDKLFVRQMGVSYGFIHEHLSTVDLVSGKSTRIEFPKSSNKAQLANNSTQSWTKPCSLLPVDDGGFFLAANDGVYQYSANGLIIGKSHQVLKGGKRLLGTHRGRVVFADAKSVRHVKISPVKTIAKK